MANKVEVKLNFAGVGELLRSKEVKDACKTHASKIQSRCGDGYKTGDFMGSDRVKATVYPETNAARNDNLENNTILKALK